jgi:hypothetical protein
LIKAELHAFAVKFCFYHLIISIVPITALAAFWVAIMTFCAGGRMKGLGMTGAAAAATVVHTAATFISYSRMRTAVFRRPIVDRMAGNTVQSEQTRMVGWVGMTTRTYRGQAGKLAGGMTALAGHICVPAYQSEPC